MVVSYFLFRCVLVTFVGRVSSSAYASLDDGMAHYVNCNRTSVRYALITYLSLIHISEPTRPY